jgi:hypothetical protein
VTNFTNVFRQLRCTFIYLSNYDNIQLHSIYREGPWSYGSWIYNYICNQCLSPLMLWVRIFIGARIKTLYDQDCQWLLTGRWFSPGPSNKTDRHDNWNIVESGVKHHQTINIQVVWVGGPPPHTLFWPKSRNRFFLIASQFWKLDPTPPPTFRTSFIF